MHYEAEPFSLVPFNATNRIGSSVGDYEGRTTAWATEKEHNGGAEKGNETQL
jgi:hypothetical protein